jgi:hypothetical protein
MLLKTIERSHKRTSQIIIVAVLVCDTCRMQFDRPFAQLGKKPYHFCGVKCMYAARRKGEFLHLKCKSEHLATHGVENPSQRLDIKEKKKETTRKNFGVDCALQLSRTHSASWTKEIRTKRHNTMKKNGTYGKSLTEDSFFAALKMKFVDVKRQVSVNDWSIDFYVADIDTYIQFDGVYWHGLDRPIEMIKEFRSPRDKVIYDTWKRDRKQDEWFLSHDIKLVRVTDEQFKKRNVELLYDGHQEEARDPGGHVQDPDERHPQGASRRA